MMDSRMRALVAVTAVVFIGGTILGLVLSGCSDAPSSHQELKNNYEKMAAEASRLRKQLQIEKTPQADLAEKYEARIKELKGQLHIRDREIKLLQGSKPGVEMLALDALLAKEFKAVRKLEADAERIRKRLGELEEEVDGKADRVHTHLGR